MRIQEKEIDFKVRNPGKLSVKQRCIVCQECGDVYFNSNQVSELSGKLKRRMNVQ